MIEGDIDVFGDSEVIPSIKDEISRNGDIGLVAAGPLPKPIYIMVEPSVLRVHYDKTPYYGRLHPVHLGFGAHSSFVFAFSVWAGSGSQLHPC
jgi:hypothetical protein